MKCGLVLEGGSRKGLFTAGIIDAFLDNNVHFDYVIGVSAGAHAAINFITEQHGRTRRVLTPRTVRRDGGGSFILVRDGIRKALHEMVYEYQYSKSDPFNFKKLFSSPIEYEFAMTCVETGRPAYFTERQDEKRLLDYMCASCSLPVLFSIVDIDGIHYADGCITDSVPFERAFEKGCEKVVVISTQEPWDGPVDFKKMRGVLYPLYKFSHPNLYRALMNRFDNYNKMLARLESAEAKGKAFVFRPTEVLCDLFETDAKKIDSSYSYGYRYAKEQMKSMKEFLGQN